MHSLPVTVQQLAVLDSRYRVEREIGRGGMATVYLAEDRKHFRNVAVKVLRPELAATIGFARFQREIEIAAQLNHPHILALFDSGEVEGLLYYVMPLIAGESLRDRLARDARVPLPEAIAITRQVAAALDYAHSRGIVHRDIKPENILVAGPIDGTPTGRHAIVCDFGIAAALDEARAADARLTQTGLLLGTPHYMSPEQAAGEARLDARSDIYSLGCVLYEMLTGEPPFMGASAPAVLAQRLHRTPAPAATRNPAVPPWLDAVVGRALATDRDARYPRAADLLRDLDTGATTVHAPSLATQSVLVLPFANLSPDPENAYFADGLTDEIISDLSKIRSLRVISRASAMRLKGTTTPLPVIAREVDVRYVLEGSVRRAGNNVRISAQLVDSVGDTPVWAEKYTGTLDDVFAIQESLSRTIVAALQVALSPAEEERLTQRRSRDLAAFECYHSAMFEAWRFTDEGIENALRYLRNGVEHLGASDLLLAATGYVYFQCINAGLRLDQDCGALANEYASRALTVNPSSGFGLAVRGCLQVRAGAMQDGVRTLKQALAMDPNSPEALFWLSYAYLTAGKPDMARRHGAHLIAIDPLTPMNHCVLGWANASDRSVEEAVPYYRRLLAMDPASALGRYLLGLLLTWAQHTSEALDVLDDLATALPRTLFGQLARAYAGAIRQDLAPLREMLDSGLGAVARSQEFFCLRIAEMCGMAGERDGVIEWLERAMSLGATDWPWQSSGNPCFVDFRSNPAYLALMSRMKVAWESFEV
ncbi:MAG: protein kinase domain-containing protein [Gemmatimonadaceae bacterium]